LEALAELDQRFPDRQSLLDPLRKQKLHFLQLLSGFAV